MRLSNLILAMGIVIITSCKSQNNEEKYITPIENSTVAQLKNQGFKRELIDIPMYSKQIADTTITITFTHDELSQISQSWAFTYETKPDSIKLDSFFKRYSTYLWSDYNENTNVFYLYNSKVNSIYVGRMHFNDVNDNWVMAVVFYLPRRN
jgi:hypothetical protein